MRPERTSTLVYLDYNATTPVEPQVIEAMLPWLRHAAGNPSSAHAWGKAARRAVQNARAQVADLLGCDPEEVVFTSGGSESCNHAVKGTAWALRDAGRHMIVSAIEHPAVLEPARWLERWEWKTSYLPVGSDGVVDADALGDILTPETVLVGIMHANNETGVIQPLEHIAERLRGHGARLFADCAQSAGKIPVRVRELGLDLAALAGHKLYAPKGIGALYVRRGLCLENLIHGAGQENGRRAGTEAVALTVALGEACRLAAGRLTADRRRLAALRDDLAMRLRALVPNSIIHGEQSPRLPGTLSIAFPGQNAGALLAALHDRLAASAGAACHGRGVNISSVLAAMGVPEELARGTIRFSVGHYSEDLEMEQAAALVSQALGSRP